MGCLSVPRTARSGHQGSSLSRKSLFLCQDNGADSEQVRYAKRECDFFDFFKRSRNNVAYHCVQCGCSSFGFSLKAKLDPGQQSLPKRLAARAALRSVPSWRPRDLTRRPRLGTTAFWPQIWPFAVPQHAVRVQDATHRGLRTRERCSD